ncbi:MAG: aryl-alcohol dehydrogenase [Dethiosulfovibrio peptidovorans]|nr:MAG: aryl-alcohol dehydrogenase [Dethiosulfovibrio peptidovorans]
MIQERLFDRLGLGTAQFGLSYGISNRRGCTEPDEVAAILRYGHDRGLRCLDTAPVYGNAESVLGRTMPEGHEFLVVSKVPSGGSSPLEGVSRTLRSLGVPSLYGVLVHNAQDLLGSQEESLWCELCRCREEGLTQKIGVSLYRPQEAEAVLERYDVDLVQFPMNILDQRFLQNDLLGRMKRRGLELHVRSCFLQGLLLMEPDEPSSYFDAVRPLLRSLRDIGQDRGLSPLAMALGFCLAVPEVDRLVVGVNGLEHLKEIGQVLSQRPERWGHGLSSFAVDDPAVVEPVYWPKEADTRHGL